MAAALRIALKATTDPMYAAQIAQPITTESHTPAYGTSKRLWSMNKRWKGKARSRASAKKRREDAVQAVIAAEPWAII